MIPWSFARRSGTFHGGRVDLAIEVEGKLVGEIQTYAPTDRQLPPATYDLGVALYDPQDRRRGFGTQAVRLLVGWLFGIGADRVQGAAVPRGPGPPCARRSCQYPILESQA